MNTFSERQGLVGSTALGPTVMPIEVRNRIWNVVQNYIDKEFQGRSNRNVAILYIWDKFFKENENYLKKSPIPSNKKTNVCKIQRTTCLFVKPFGS